MKRKKRWKAKLKRSGKQMADNDVVTTQAADGYSQAQLADALWQFSVAFYPSQQALLLRLQDEYQANINICLCICWLSLQQRQLTETQLNQIITAIAPVNQHVTQPLRQIRRQLTAETLPLKPALLAAELQAEQHEQLRIAEVLADCWLQLVPLRDSAWQAYFVSAPALQPLLVDLDQAIRAYTPSLGETLI